MPLQRRKAGIARSFISSINRTLQRHGLVAEEILESYGVGQSEWNNDDTVYSAILSFCGDVSFRASAIAFASGWDHGASYLYRFNQPNPWDGPWKGLPAHITDIAFLWQNFSEYLSLPEVEVSKDFAADIIQFVYGKPPWPAFNSTEELSREYSEYSRRGAMKPVNGSSTPADRFVQRCGPDALLDAIQAFIAGV